jgi:hypothetical protein
MTAGSPPDIPRLDVAVDSMPVPGLLRPSIEAALAGRALGAGPESTVARAVAAATESGTAGTGGTS